MCRGVARLANTLLPSLGVAQCPVDPLDSWIGAYPMSESRAFGFALLADMLCYCHAHLRHGSSTPALLVGQARLRVVATCGTHVATVIEARAH